MAAVTSLARHAASLATSASSREPRRSKVHRAMEWPKPSSARSSVTMSASVRVRMQTPSCSSYQFGSLTTTRFTRTRHSDIVHPVSSSQLTEARDRVRSFGGYNTKPIHNDYFLVAARLSACILERFLPPLFAWILERSDFFFALSPVSVSRRSLIAALAAS